MWFNICNIKFFVCFLKRIQTGVGHLEFLCDFVKFFINALQILSKYRGAS